MQDWLSERAQTHPKHAFLRFPDRPHISFAEMNDLVAKRAFQLTQEGMQAGDMVGLRITDQLDFVQMALAVLRLNATIVPLNLRLTDAEIAWQIENAGCKFMVHDEGFSLQNESITRLVVSALPDETNQKDLQKQAPTDSQSYNGTHGGDVAPFAVIHTSGTSGKPKGAVLTFDNVYYSAKASKERLGVFPDDLWLCILPLYHVGGLSIIMRSILYGTSVMLYPRFEVDAINNILTDYPITLVSLVPTMLRRLIDARENEWNDKLRLVLLGGAAPSNELVQTCLELDIPVATTYGLSEASSQVATSVPEDTVRKPKSVGKAMPYTAIRVADEHGDTLPAGEVGEILVKGKTVFREYINNPDATAKTLVNGELHTGDMGYVDDDGDLFIVNRRSDLIVTGGENVYPAEVETVLRHHPAVHEAVVVGVDDEEWGQKVSCAIVVKNGMRLTEAEIVAYCNDHLAGYKRPRLIRFVDEFPLTASGKIQRGEVRKMMNRFAALIDVSNMTINDVNYAYRVMGQGEPILVLHGFTGNQQQWDEVAEALMDEYQVVTVDLLGHGATDSPEDYERYSMDLSARNLVKLMQSLGHDTFHLLGYSMGGRLALYTAIHHPPNIKSLILESASPGLRTEKARLDRRNRDNTLADNIETNGIEWFVDFWEKLPLWDSQSTLSQDVRDQLREQRLTNNPRGLANSLRGMGTGVQPSLWDDIDKLDLPISLIVGQFDEKFVVINHELYDLFPRSDLSIVDDAGHTVHLENRDTFIRLIHEHLSH